MLTDCGLRGPRVLSHLPLHSQAVKPDAMQALYTCITGPVKRLFGSAMWPACARPDDTLQVNTDGASRLGLESRQTAQKRGEMAERSSKKEEGKLCQKQQERRKQNKAFIVWFCEWCAIVGSQAFVFEDSGKELSCLGACRIPGWGGGEREEGRERQTDKSQAKTDTGRNANTGRGG